MVLANFGLQLLECLFGLMFGDSDFAVLWAVLILIIAGLAVLHYFLFEKPPKIPFLTSKGRPFGPPFLRVGTRAGRLPQDRGRADAAPKKPRKNFISQLSLWRNC